MLYKQIILKTKVFLQLYVKLCELIRLNIFGQICHRQSYCLIFCIFVHAYCILDTYIYCIVYNDICIVQALVNIYKQH